jgi:phospholipid/cholesterol/gamma-HCH transport system ATP-binding protein
VIELRNVSKRFVANVVLDGVNFTVQKGETVALLGPSGVGKSVLLKHIIGLIKPDAGEVFVDGQNVSLLKRKELSQLRQRIGYVFQNGALFDSMDVEDNIRLGITDDDLYRDFTYCAQRVRECLRLVNLQPEVLRRFPAELSGGMRKRVGIARAIAGKPTYLLYDEPTSGLDPVNSDVIDGLVEKLQLEIGVTSVMVTHDVRGAFRTADRIALLSQAKIRAMGTADELLASRDAAVQQFLERDFEMQLSQQQQLPRKSRASAHGTQL